jgi:hypothetical protein
MKILMLYKNESSIRVFDGEYYFERTTSKGKWNKVEGIPSNFEEMPRTSETISFYRSLRHLPRFAHRPGLEWEIDFLRSITYVDKAKATLEIFGKPFEVELGCTIAVDEDLNVFEFNSKPFYVKRLRRWFSTKASHLVKQIGTVENLTEEQCLELPYRELVSRPVVLRNSMAGMDIVVATILNSLDYEESCDVMGLNEYLLKDILKRLGVSAKIQNLTTYKHRLRDVEYVNR